MWTTSTTFGQIKFSYITTKKEEKNYEKNYEKH
jgi:hypothetical protein